MEILEPTNSDALLQADWMHLLKVLGMCQDRVRSEGAKITIHTPWHAKHVPDRIVLETMAEGLKTRIEEILRNAVIVRP